MRCARSRPAARAYSKSGDRMIGARLRSEAGALRGGHHVRHESRYRHHTARDGRNDDMGVRHGDVLQDVHESHHPILRCRRCGCGADVVGRGVAG